MTDPGAPTSRLARGWDNAAEGYEAYHVPRFAPWVETAVGVLDVLDEVAAEGPVLVPACGTFPELEPLARRVPHHEVVGIDLSAGMVALARGRAAGHERARVVLGDAAALDDWSGRCAAVVSVFGLQQLPDPVMAMASWAAALRPGGVLSVVYWPEVPETDGPYAVMSRVLRPDGPADDDASWEADVVPALVGQDVTVVWDELVAHEITHPDAAAFVDAHVIAGPLRPLLADHGPKFLEALHTKVVSLAPRGPWTHTPQARHVVAVRPAARG